MQIFCSCTELDFYIFFKHFYFYSQIYTFALESMLANFVFKAVKIIQIVLDCTNCINSLIIVTDVV